MQWANKCNIVWKNVNSSPPVPNSAVCDWRKGSETAVQSTEEKKKPWKSVCVRMCVPLSYVQLHHIKYCLCIPFCKNVFTYYLLFLLCVRWACVMSKRGVIVNTRGITDFMPFCRNSKTRSVMHIGMCVCLTFHLYSTLHENNYWFPSNIKSEMNMPS